MHSSFLISAILLHHTPATTCLQPYSQQHTTAQNYILPYYLTILQQQLCSLTILLQHCLAAHSTAAHRLQHCLLHSLHTQNSPLPASSTPTACLKLHTCRSLTAATPFQTPTHYLSPTLLTVFFYKHLVCSQSNQAQTSLQTHPQLKPQLHKNAMINQNNPKY